MEDSYAEMIALSEAINSMYGPGTQVTFSRRTFKRIQRLKSWEHSGVFNGTDRFAQMVK